MNSDDGANADWLSKLETASGLLSEGKTAEAATLIAKAVNAAPPDPQLPPQTRARVVEARATLAKISGSMDRYLRSRLSDIEQPIDSQQGPAGPSRAARAIDLLLGQRALYFQQPEKFYFPELPQIEFYEPEGFDWTRDIVKCAPAIRDELFAFLSEENDAFEPYVPATHQSATASTSDLTGNLDWGAIHLFKDGVANPKTVPHFPATMEALARAPQPGVQTLSPIALFSRLTPGARIPPHHGLVNTRLICHLPIAIADDCAIRVGSQTRPWREGEMLIFDDSIEHEAWNNSSVERIILLFDIWRPEITADERRFIEIVFQAVADFQAGAAS
ncbi:MAG: aspartyl/asparaginyl beta-hydroxylase domain-containing protein [Pseudomonadota bacterium]